MQNGEFAKELHKPIIKKNWKTKSALLFHRQYLGCWSCSYAIDQSKLTEGFRFLLCVVDIFSKYAWVIPLKNKKGFTITTACQKVWD